MNSRYIEFIGLPGSGKTTLSINLFEILIMKGFKVNNLTYVIGNKHNKVIRVLLKLLLGTVCLVGRPIVSCHIFKLLIDSKQKNRKDFIKLMGNLIYLIGYISFCGFNNKFTILDQGLFQALLSVDYSANRKLDIIHIKKIIDCVFRKKIIIISLNVDKKTALDRIVKRNSNNGRIDLKLNNNKLLKKNLNDASDSLEYIIDLIRVDLNAEKVNFLEIKSVDHDFTESIDFIVSKVIP